MKILLDTNVILDILIQGRNGFADASLIWEAAKEGRIECFVTASSMTDVFYISRSLIRKQPSAALSARQIVRFCLDALTVIAVDRDDLEQAYRFAGQDFEDDLQIACTARLLLDAIITSDVNGGFNESRVLILSPAQMVDRLRSLAEQSPDTEQPPQVPNSRRRDRGVE